MHKLRAQLGKHILFRILECRLHAGGGRDPSRRPRFSQKSSLTVGFPRLPDYTTDIQITNQHLVKVSLRRIIPGHWLAIHSDPDVVSSRSLVLLDLSDYCKMCLVISIQPVQKQADDVIRTYSSPCCVRDQLHEQSALFVCIRLIPLPESFAYQCQILFAVNSVVDFFAKPFQPRSHLIKSLPQKLQPLMMVQYPLFDQVVARDITLADFVARCCRKNPANPRDAT